MDLLQQAIGMQRGPILADLVSSRAIAAEVDQLCEQYATACEDWAEVKLSLGQHTDILDSIEQMIRSSPFRERLRHAYMLALYRSGRQAEALAQFDAVRQLLARELGLEPSPVLVRLSESILHGEQRTAPEVSGRVTPAAARTKAVGAYSLTRDVTDFTGRDDEVKALLGTLGKIRRHGVVVVSGPAGAGKTALVVHCAHRLADRFPDGRILTCLRAPDGRPRPTADLLGEMLRALGMTGALPAGSDERAALLRESVAGQEVLVILDDAATELHVRSVLAAAADAVAIVTSRRHLGGLESAVRLVVGPLPESMAVEMLSRLIGYERIYAEPEMARRIVAVCDRLPLAIRIAGAKLAGLRHLTLAQYAGRLADERRLLDELAAGDLVIRSRFAAWYQDLHPDEQATLRCLASLPHTSFAVGDVTACLLMDAVRAEAAVERLIAAHLVQARAEEVEAHSGGYGATYSLPMLVRAFTRGLMY